LIVEKWPVGRSEQSKIDNRCGSLMPEDNHKANDAEVADATVTPHPAVKLVDTEIAPSQAELNPALVKAPADAAKPTTPVAVKAAAAVGATAGGAKPTAAKAGASAGAPVAKTVVAPGPPPTPFKALPSMPLSMTNAPPATTSTTDQAGDGGHNEAAGDDFARALAALKPLTMRHQSMVARLWRSLRGRSRETGTDEDRHVAFDGYRGTQHDDKIERDRRYGTVYTVIEYANGYLVRLELPRRMPSSSLKQVWHLEGAVPEYDCVCELSHNVLVIRGRLHEEALRRLAHVSASFPSGFMTRIEFGVPVKGITYRVRGRTVEVVVGKLVR
jgi:hypothetical protein